MGAVTADEGAQAGDWVGGGDDRAFLLWLEPPEDVGTIGTALRDLLTSPR